MLRILLIIAVLVIGYDAVVYQGANTRAAWTGLVGLTDSAVAGAKQLSQNVREETGSLKQ